MIRLQPVNVMFLVMQAHLEVSHLFDYAFFYRNLYLHSHTAHIGFNVIRSHQIKCTAERDTNVMQRKDDSEKA